MRSLATLALPAMGHWGTCTPSTSSWTELSEVLCPTRHKIVLHSCQICSGFCVPQLLKLVYFSFYWKKWKGFIGFFLWHSVYMTPILCYLMRVTWVVLMSFCAPPRAKSWRRHCFTSNHLEHTEADFWPMYEPVSEKYVYSKFHSFTTDCVSEEYNKNHPFLSVCLYVCLSVRLFPF